MTLIKHIRAWQLVMIAVIAICGAFLVGVSVAKMASNVNSESGGLGVAKWEVHANGSGGNVSLVAGSDIAESYTITVVNESEVATGYSIEVSNIPDGILVALGEGEWGTPEDGSVTFSDVGTLSASGDSDEKVLKFKADIETGNIPDGEIVVNVIFTQEEL